MHPERLDRLRQEYTGQLVVVDGTRPELARFQGMTGQVKTVNFNGRALVEFDGNNNQGWYDIELDYLKVVEPSEPDDAEVAEKPEEEVKLSPLELARMAKESKPKSPPAEPPKPADTN